MYYFKRSYLYFAYYHHRELAHGLFKIKKLIDLLNESAIGEIEVKSGEESVRISKQSLPLRLLSIHIPNPTPNNNLTPPAASNNIKAYPFMHLW